MSEGMCRKTTLPLRHPLMEKWGCGSADAAGPGVSSLVVHRSQLEGTLEGGFLGGTSDTGVMAHRLQRRSRQLSYQFSRHNYTIHYNNYNCKYSDMYCHIMRSRNGQGFVDVKLTLTSIPESTIEAGGPTTRAESSDFPASGV